jgi:hypothetical protein
VDAYEPAWTQGIVADVDLRGVPGRYQRGSPGQKAE